MWKKIISTVLPSRGGTWNRDLSVQFPNLGDRILNPKPCSLCQEVLLQGPSTKLCGFRVCLAGFRAFGLVVASNCSKTHTHTHTHTYTYKRRRSRVKRQWGEMFSLRCRCCAAACAWLARVPFCSRTHQHAHACRCLHPH
jgi:hypothetical protein